MQRSTRMQLDPMMLPLEVTSPARQDVGVEAGEGEGGGGGWVERRRDKKWKEKGEEEKEEEGEGGDVKAKDEWWKKGR